MIHCPNCSAGLRFDIGSQQMTCDHCDSRFDPAALDYRDKDDAKSAEMFDSYVYVCPSCGAELMTTDKTDAIGFCPFCGGASMLFDKLKKQWRPDYVIPFRITKEQCKEFYVKAAQKSIFTSRKYSDPKLIESFRGIYMPFWEYEGEQKGSYYLHGAFNGVFHKSEYEISGQIDYILEGYAHDASRAFDDRISENITPYDIAGHKPFAPGYLCGFYADVGDEDKWRFRKYGEESMIKATAAALAQESDVTDAGSFTKLKIDEDNSKVPTNITKGRRVLYPVWFMSYRNKNNITYAAVNGQTGKVSADFPVSPLRVMIAVLLLGAALAALLFLLPSVKANGAAAMTSLMLLLGVVILHLNYKNVLKNNPELVGTPEVKRFKKPELFLLILGCIGVVGGFAVVFLDFAYNIVTYSVCLLLAGILFLMMFVHIRFQVNIAKRRPPQFNKKGAQYDEN